MKPIYFGSIIIISFYSFIHENITHSNTENNLENEKTSPISFQHMFASDDENWGSRLEPERVDLLVGVLRMAT